MKIEAHLAKFARFEAFRRQFDPIEDFDLWYWCLLSAGTTLINAALHAARVTRAENLFATQVPDVYAVPDAQGWHHEIAFLTDLIHVGLPEMDAELPQPLQTAFHEMALIERYRDPCVRGDHAITHEIASEIAAAYDRCIVAAREVVDTSMKMVS